ncbi:hypothetical protein ACIBLA_00705 [Streptomyces sp. NPDC050433]|uniref:hypothetical protein n=1 Tax=unclassified Streptomyces TaxID=2593676 RepID=UPI003429DB06
MSASESTETPPAEPTTPTQTSTPDPSSVSMSDLLASCAAASAVSTPPPAETRADVEDTADRDNEAA